MKKSVKLFSVVAIVFLFFATSCKKCEECHYDGPQGEVELGELCDEDLEDFEKNGVVIDGTVYEVHCHGH